MLDEDSSRSEPLSPALAPLFWESQEAHLDPSLWAISMIKLRQLAARINNNSTQPQFWDSGIKSTKILGPVAHCILSIPRLDITISSSRDIVNPTIALREATRLALLVLMALLKRAFSLIADELHSLLEKLWTVTPLLATISCFPGLRLWISFVHACAIEEPISELQLANIHRAMRELDISRGSQAFCEAEKVIWIHCLLDDRARPVQEQIDRYLADNQYIL